MKLDKRSYALLALGFVTGTITMVLGVALARAPVPHPNGKYTVSIDEVKQNLVQADEFTGSYSHRVTLSDGSQHQITLTPVLHDGVTVLDVTDTSSTGRFNWGYVGPNGTMIYGPLMINIKDAQAARVLIARMRANRPASHPLP